MTTTTPDQTQAKVQVQEKKLENEEEGELVDTNNNNNNHDNEETHSTSPSPSSSSVNVNHDDTQKSSKTLPSPSPSPSKASPFLQRKFSFSEHMDLLTLAHYKFDEIRRMNNKHGGGNTRNKSIILNPTQQHSPKKKCTNNNTNSSRKSMSSNLTCVTERSTSTTLPETVESRKNAHQLLSTLLYIYIMLHKVEDMKSLLKQYSLSTYQEWHMLLDSLHPPLFHLSERSIQNSRSLKIYQRKKEYKQKFVTTEKALRKQQETSDNMQRDFQTTTSQMSSTIQELYKDNQRIEILSKENNCLQNTLTKTQQELLDTKQNLSDIIQEKQELYKRHQNVLLENTKHIQQIQHLEHLDQTIHQPTIRDLQAKIVQLEINNKTLQEQHMIEQQTSQEEMKLLIEQKQELELTNAKLEKDLNHTQEKWTQSQKDLSIQKKETQDIHQNQRLEIQTHHDNEKQLWQTLQSKLKDEISTLKTSQTENQKTIEFLTQQLKESNPKFESLLIQNQNQLQIYKEEQNTSIQKVLDNVLEQTQLISEEKSNLILERTQQNQDALQLSIKNGNSKVLDSIVSSIQKIQQQQENQKEKDMIKNHELELSLLEQKKNQELELCRKDMNQINIDKDIFISSQTKEIEMLNMQLSKIQRQQQLTQQQQQSIFISDMMEKQFEKLKNEKEAIVEHHDNDNDDDDTNIMEATLSSSSCSKESYKDMRIETPRDDKTSNKLFEESSSVVLPLSVSNNTITSNSVSFVQNVINKALANRNSI